MNQFFLLMKSKLFLLLQILATFLIPIKPLLLLVGGAILCDTITGIVKAYKKKEKITSYKLSRVITKMLLYQCTLISIYFLDKYLLGEFIKNFSSITFFVTKLTAMFLICLEGMSINENIKEISELNFFQLFKKMLSRVKEIKVEIVDIAKKD